MPRIHGKHVLCEKPLGLNAADALRTVEYCREKGVLLSVDLMMRHGAHINHIREAVAAGEIGQVVSADARFSVLDAERVLAHRSARAAAARSWTQAST